MPESAPHIFHPPLTASHPIPAVQQNRRGFLSSFCAVITSGAFSDAAFAQEKKNENKEQQKTFALSFSAERKGHIQLPVHYQVGKPCIIEVIATPVELKGKESTVVGNHHNSGMAVRLSKDNHWEFIVHNGHEYKEARSKKKAEEGKKEHIVAMAIGNRIQLIINNQLQENIALGDAYKPSGRPFMVGADPDSSGHAQHHFSGKVELVGFSSIPPNSAHDLPSNRSLSRGKSDIVFRLNEGRGMIIRDILNRFEGRIEGKPEWIEVKN